MGQYICEKCHENVDEGAVRCPHCGYAPAEDLARKAKWYKRTAGVLYLTIIGLPIAYPLGKKGERLEAEAERVSVGVPSE